MSQPPSRSSTGFSGPRTSSSFKITASKSRVQSFSHDRKEDMVTLYDLERDDLKRWLETRFSGRNFEGEMIKAKGDKYLVMVPEKLTEEEKEDIYKLRKAPAPPAEPDY